VQSGFLLVAIWIKISAFPMMRILPITLRACCLLVSSAPLLCLAQVQQSWVSRYLGAGNYQHLSSGPVLGSNGVVYIAGYMNDSLGDPQFVTVKYDAAGNEQWAVPYNGAPLQPDTASAIKMTSDGSVVVTGRSGPDTASEFATIQYSPAGTEVWSRRYNAGLDSDQPTVMAVDQADNIYVAGATSSLSGDSDIVTVKYATEGTQQGTQQWTATFAGLSGQIETVSGIAVDGSGNVYITGRSQAGADWDYYVVKYSAGGTQLWVGRYNGPLRQFDSPAAILVDAQGSVYVSGTSLGQSVEGATRFELATVKFDAAGNQVWTARYIPPGAENAEIQGGMAFDPAGNLLLLAYLHGASEQECALIKYDPNGNRVWTARYNAGAGQFDAGYALAIDASTNTYVAAVSEDPAGWRFATLKFDSAGNRLWAAKFIPDGIFDVPVGIAVNPGGDVYVAGQSRYFEGPGGFVTIKYIQTAPPSSAPRIQTQPASQSAPGGTNVTFSVSATGAPPLSFQWRHNGQILPDATNSSLILFDLTLENSGQYSVEVTNQVGSVATPEAELRVLITPRITSQPEEQFAFAGTEAFFSVSVYGSEPFQFQWLHNGTQVSGSSQRLTLTNLTVADAGDYQVVVSNESGAVTSAVVRLTVSRQAQQDWTDIYDGPGHSTDANPLVKVDAAGNVYVAGTSEGDSTGADFTIIKYSPSGARLWTARHPAATNSVENLFAMALDATGNVWVTGTTALPGMGRDVLTAKYSPGGVLQWTAQFGTAELFDAAYAIAVDEAGNAYITGQTGEDFLTIKYDGGGHQLWAATFNGTGNSTDTARSIAVSGTNVYVTGSSWNGSNLDFMTVKYDGQGNLLWNVPYDAGGSDSAVALAIDPLGNILVAGNSYGTVTYDKYGSDYVVLKYDAAGHRMWSARYDGFMHAEDYPTALTVDGDGNVYVTGHSDYESPDSAVRQFATLKYNSAGQELWRAWHISRQFDGSRSLVIDAEGNVYITSLASGSFSGRDIAFIKYDALGNLVLTAHYNGAENSDDTPSALAVDSAGNIYVTGTSFSLSDNGLDFVLIKYRQNSVLGLPRITSVPQGAVISFGSNITFSVTATGEEPLSYQWRFDGQNIDGATNSTLVITQAGFEHSGSYSVRVANVHGRVVSPETALVVQAPPSILSQPQTQIVAAGSTVSFSVVVDGSTPLFHEWFFNGSSLGNAGQRTLVLRNVQPSSAGTYEVLTTNRAGAVRSSPARLVVTTLAQQAWEMQYNGPAQSGDSPRAMAVGPDGSVIVTGLSLGNGADYATIKYDTSGNQMWVARYNGPESGHDFSTAVAVGGDGNVYVTGASWGGASALDIATIKYNPDGNQEWAVRFNSPDNLNDTGSAIAVDANGNVYVTGASIVGANNSDFITIKYNSSGTQLWAHRYDGPGHGYDEAVAMALDSAGRAYVTGTSTQTDGHTDFATIKYETNGTPLWVARYTRAAGSDQTAVQLRLDQTGNVYVAGDTYDTSGYPDYALVKYSATGSQLWAVRYDNPDHYYDYVSDLIVDPSGNAYITGTSHPLGQPSIYLTIKFGPAGERLWLASFTGQYDGSDVPGALAFDSAGQVCVTGTIFNGDNFDIATVCYETNGNRRWMANYAGQGNQTDTSVAIATDQFGNVFVTGSSLSNNESDFVTLKYGQQNLTGVPVMVDPPQDRLVPLGESTSFSVSAAGRPPLTYRWSFENRIIGEGEGLSTMALSNITATAAGYYTVEVFNDLGSVVSPMAELRLTGPVIPRFGFVGMTNGSLRVVVLAESGFVYRLDASSDLRNWFMVATNYNQNSSIEFNEPFTGTRRYYRAVKLP
jgi:uncharacterized delta-60 repeat protein